MKTILVDAVHCFIQEKGEIYEIFHDLHNLLETYPNKKIILTGANEDGIKKYGLDKVPYDVFTLKHDPEKNNPEYYKILLREKNLDVNDVVCFENKLDSVESARSIGIKTYHFDNSKKDLESLKEFLDENLK
jgi:HAD superfamily hydrolase (TIGR01509 family)